jgi:integrase
VPHIQRRSGPRGTRYRVRYVDPSGAERSKTFSRKADADDFATSVRHDIRSNTYIDPRVGQQPVEAYLEAWRAQQAHHRPKTAASTATRFRTMVYPYLGDRAIASVKPSTIRQWQADLLAAGYSASTVKGVRGQVAGAFNDAIRDRLLTVSPFEGVKAPEVVRDEIVPLTVAQVRAGERAAPDRYRALVTLVAETGLRAGEAWGLTRDRLDLEAGTVRVNRQLVGRDGSTPVFGPPKSRASVRTVPLAPRTVRAMEKHLANYPAEPGELVFRTLRGGPLTRTVWARAWHPKDADGKPTGKGIAPAMGLPAGAGLHQLRHFYASLLIAAGRSPKEVQERLGHASLEETLSTYVHLWHSADQGTRDAIEAAFGAPEDDHQSGRD